MKRSPDKKVMAAACRPAGPSPIEWCIESKWVLDAVIAYVDGMSVYNSMISEQIKVGSCFCHDLNSH